MIDTPRLTLRPWTEADRAPFAAMCAGPLVMRHLDGVQGRAECDAAIDRHVEAQRAHGHCFWAVEQRSDAAFLGMCGLRAVAMEGVPVTGDVEIGWRFNARFWGRGLAREAAAAALGWGFAHLPVDRIVAFTVPANERSWGLMRGLGMTRRPDCDFGHPALPVDHPLHRHVTYVMERAQWTA